MAVASQTLFLQNPTFVSPLSYSLVATTGIAFAFFSSRYPKTQYNFYRKPNIFSPNFYKPNNLTFRKTPSKPNILACSSKINPSPSQLTDSTRHDFTESTRPVPKKPTRQFHIESTHHELNDPTESTRHDEPNDPSESTRTVGTLLAITILVSRLFGHAIAKYVQGVCKMPSPNQLLTIQSIQENLISTTSPLFFAAVKVHRQQLHTPWAVMASGIAKCIEVYMAVLAIRCALSYFPQVEWNRQPYSGLREICDPFLLFFRNIVPPVFGTLDISASVGFLVLSVLLEILSKPRPF